MIHITAFPRKYIYDVIFTVFIVVYIKIKFTSEFYDCFNQEQYIKISDQLYCIFETYFNEENKSFLLSQSNENFIILFNARKNILSDIVFTLEKLAKVFEIDKNFMKLSVGVGNEYTDYEGMRKSYKESVRALAIAEMLDSIPIFARRMKFRHGVGIVILCMAIGKTIGSLIYFINGWAL